MKKTRRAERVKGTDRVNYGRGAPQRDLLRSACKNNDGLLLLDPRGSDDLLPARDFARQIFAEILR